MKIDIDDIHYAAATLALFILSISMVSGAVFGIWEIWGSPPHLMIQLTGTGIIVGLLILGIVVTIEMFK